LAERDINSGNDSRWSSLARWKRPFKVKSGDFYGHERQIIGRKNPLLKDKVTYATVQITPRMQQAFGFFGAY